MYIDIDVEMLYCIDEYSNILDVDIYIIYVYIIMNIGIVVSIIVVTLDHNDDNIFIYKYIYISSIESTSKMHVCILSITIKNHSCGLQ